MLAPSARQPATCGTPGRLFKPQARSVDCAVTAKALEQFDESLTTSPTATDAPQGPLLPVRFLRALPATCAELAIDFRQVLQDAGLEPSTFAESDRSISFAELERLFAACERLATVDHVGLLFGQLTRPDELGLARSVARCGETLGDGLRNFVAHCNLHDTPATARLTVRDGNAQFAWTLHEHCLVDTRHFDYASMAISCNLLRDLAAAGLRPQVVRFATRHPVAAAAFEAFFGVPVEFDAERSEIEFDARVLEQKLPALEASARAAIAAELQQARLALLADLPVTLRRILRKRLLISDFSMDDVAAQLSMHRRTLDRRLQRCATTYGEVLEQVRDDIARQLLRDTQFSIQRIAESVRFSSAANFATAFRRRTGMTPTEYRRAG